MLSSPDGIRVRLDAALLFDTAKWDLKPSARQAIRNLSEVIAAYPGAAIRVVGFTDAVGGDDYNLDLSRSRALSVKDALAALNPPGDVTFETDGLGKAKPVASNDTAAGRALNRRVEVLITPQAATTFDATARPDVQSQAAVTPAGAPKRATAVPPPAAPVPVPQPPRRGEAAAGPRPNSPEMVAAVARVKDVIERYAEALNGRDEEALRGVRAEVSESEATLLRAREVRVVLEVVTVTVNGTTATATCRRTVEAMSSTGTPIRASGTAVLHLTRQPTGWTITDIK